ncbi:MAG: isopentenyl phosphate kinase, partial [Candidatus Bathyarchaeia archaeon]
MSRSKATVLKIGGSVITDKSEELKARTQIMDRLAEEILKANKEKLMIVHGGGSFGHPSAQRNAIREGFKKTEQIIGFAETHHYMTVLNGLFMDSLVVHGIPAVSITPSSCITTENGRIKKFEDEPLKMMLEMGFIPVLYGDAVMDTKQGFAILSGDQLVSALATRFDAEQIIIGVDVDGLFDVDPKTEKTAKLFTRLTLKELKKIKEKIAKPVSPDVTGGMLGKIE